ncbi:unnamed protein product [Rotaria sordida]|uniref:Cytochrome P450 n=1 Tax=Rotaria sordida TaxID=392033 RepID=A0A819TD31_9BILA|nr:unnamed protein product [Rotaria sordida]
MIGICNIEDIQHVFSHQHIYEQGIVRTQHHALFIPEVLRFGPPVSFTVRNVTIDDRPPIICGAQLYKGDEVMINIYNLTRDKRYWKIDPGLFYPERFQDEDKDYHRYASFPFAGGHRQCMGQDLARLALKAITARLMQHVTFDDGGPEVNAGGHSWKITLTPKNIGVTITFD